MLGYNASTQAATGFSPYQLMFGVTAYVSSSVRPLFAAPLPLDDPVLAAASLFQRGLAMAEQAAAALGNLQIAQQRDQRRYLLTRAGAYTGRAEKFTPGTYVYVQRQEAGQLQSKALDVVLRVREVKPSGVLLLEGSCGNLLSLPLEHCALCHGDVLDETTYPMLARPPADLACSTCSRTDGEASMLLCDACGAGYHLWCLRVPLLRVPTGDWFCETCVAGDLSEQQLRQRAAEARQRAAEAMARQLPAPIERRSKGAHQRYDGQELRLQQTDGASCTARVTYVGHQAGCALFRLQLPGGVTEQVTLYELKARIKAAGSG
jgi:hypothetical protein